MSKRHSISSPHSTGEAPQLQVRRSAQMALGLLPNAAPCDDVSSAIYFLHIPKTAGTTLNWFLESLFNDFEICSPKDWRKLVKVNSQEFSNYKLFRGHFYAYVHRFVPVPMRYLTFLRDPVDRALSHYAHVLRDEQHYFHNRAKQLGDFGAYLRDPETRMTVCNFQLRGLTLDLNPLEILPGLTPDQLGAAQLERQLETAPGQGEVSELVQVAKERLEQMCLVGITERFNDSLQLLCQTFGWPYPLKLEAQNVSSARVTKNQLATKDLALLKSANEGDYEIYDFANSLLTKRREKAKLVYPGFDAFISYAQNCEDVMLFRALGKLAQGFYVDVGAHHPVDDSVTKAFYDRGWRGINIEPVPELYQQFVKERPDDINVNVAIGSNSGKATLYDIPGTGLATLYKRVADRHRELDFPVRTLEVSVATLNDVCEAHKVSVIHFLKIDAEGAEKEILAGLDLRRYRPWIVVVEATEPNTSISTHQHWEHYLTDNDYVFTYFDGTNRYYVASEHEHLRSAFDHTPGVSDRFIKYGTQLQDRELADLRAKYRKLFALNERISSLHAKNQSLVNELQELRRNYTEIATLRERENLEAQKHVAALTQWGTTAETYAKSLVEELAHLRPAHEQAQKQIGLLNEQLGKLHEQTKIIADLRDALREATETEPAWRAGLDSGLQHQGVALKQLATEMEARAKALLEQLTSARVAYEDAQKQLVVLNTQVSTLKSLDEERQGLRRALEQERANRARDDSQSRERIDALAERVIRLEEQAAALHQELDNARGALLDERSNRAREHTESRQVIAALDERAVRSEEQAKSVSDELERVRRALREEQVSHTRERAEFNERMATLNERAIRSEEQAKSLRSELERLRQALADQQTTHAHERTEGQERLSALNERLAKSDDQVKQLLHALDTERVERVNQQSRASEVIEALTCELGAIKTHWSYRLIRRISKPYKQGDR